MGLLARENATALNAALHHVATEVAASLQSGLQTRGIDALTFFAQNDGTLMGVDHATRFPVLTIGSGPANSIRGTAFLTGLNNALVADVGGTSTDFVCCWTASPARRRWAPSSAGCAPSSRCRTCSALASVWIADAVESMNLSREITLVVVATAAP